MPKLLMMPGILLGWKNNSDQTYGRVSRHHGVQLRAPLETCRPSEHYRTEGFKGCDWFGPHYDERRQSLREQMSFFFQIEFWRDAPRETLLPWPTALSYSLQSQQIDSFTNAFSQGTFRYSAKIVYFEPNLDFNFLFPIDLAPNGITFVAKSFWKV